MAFVTVMRRLSGSAANGLMASAVWTCVTTSFGVFSVEVDTAKVWIDVPTAAALTVLGREYLDSYHASETYKAPETISED